MSPSAQVEYLSYIIENNALPAERLFQRKQQWAAAEMGPETREVLRLKQAYSNLYGPLVAERNRGWPHDGRTGQARHPLEHQRHRRRLAQYGLMDSM